MSIQFNFIRRPIVITIESLFTAILMAGYALTAQADCTGTDPNYTCTGDSTNSSGTTMVGGLVIDATVGATLTNEPISSNIPVGMITNILSYEDSTDGNYALYYDPNIGSYITGVIDVGTVSTGAHSVISSTGGSSLNIINNGRIVMDRRSVSFGYLDENQTQVWSWSADANGNLLTNQYQLDVINPDPVTGLPTPVLTASGTPAGVAAAIHVDQNTNELIITNHGGIAPNEFFGAGAEISAMGDFTAAIYGNARIQTITLTGDQANGYGSIANWSHSGAIGDTLTEGHWAIANYGSGLTTINNSTAGNYIYGDILLVDRNPLKMAAQIIDSALTLSYSAEEVGPRNSLIDNYGTIGGNIYLGSGEHHLINRSTTETGGGIAASINGNIYVDQNDSEGVSGGAKKFTLEQRGGVYGDIIINDADGSVNTVTIDQTEGGSGLTGNLTALNSVGDNTVELNCGQFRNCDVAGSISGFNTLTMRGNNSQWTLWGAGIQLNQAVYLQTGVVDLQTLLTVPEVYVNSTSTLAASTSNGMIDGNLTNNGTLDLHDQMLNVTGDVTLAAGSKFKTTITNTSNGQLVVGGTGTIDNSATVIPTTVNHFVQNGEQITIATNTIGSAQVQNSGLVRWLLSDASGDLVLTASTNAAITLPGLSKGATNALNTVMNYNGTDIGLINLAKTLQNLDEANVRLSGERLRPEANDGLIRMVLTSTDKTLGMVESHLFDTHLATLNGRKIGSSANLINDKPKGAGIWFQGFGFTGTQEKRQSIDGYTSSATGMAFGADRPYSERLRLGGAFSYAYGNVDGLGATDNHRININSYLASIYSSWAGDAWYLNGALGLGRHIFNSNRTNVGLTAHGTHDGWQATAKVDAGWPISMSENATFVPVTSLAYSRLSETGYSEKGSAIALKLNGRDTESLRTGLGGKLLYLIQQNDWVADIEFRALWNHEFANLSPDSTARFVAGGDQFTSPGIKTTRDDFTLGSSLRLTGSEENDDISLLFSYDANKRAQFISHALLMQLRYEFDGGHSLMKRALVAKEKTVAKAITAIQVNENDIAVIQKMIAPETYQTTQAEKAVNTTIEAWKAAQNRGDVDAYLKFYAPNFTSGSGSDRTAQFEQFRKKVTNGNTHNKIAIAEMIILPQGKGMSAIFTESSISDNQSYSVKKLVDLEQKDGNWLIVREDSMTLVE